MSFILDLKTAMTSDASVNALATGGIKFGHLPEDFDIKKNWIAYDFRISDTVNCLSGLDAYIQYALSVTLTATDTIVLNNMADLLRNHLVGYSSTNIVDIAFANDSKLTVLSKTVNTYQDSLEFIITYLP